VDGVPSSYLVDAQGGLPTLVDDGSKAYLHADGLLGEVGGGTRYALEDALGSVRGLADEAGSLVGTASHEAFGATRTSSGASSLFGFTGEPTDATGLVYLRARTLDPATGRFLSADSVIPNAPGTSGYLLYAYAGNNPTTWTDPTGHFVLTEDAFRQAVKHVAGILLTYGVGAVGGIAIVLRTTLGTLPTVVTALAVVIVAIIVIVAVFWVVSGLDDPPEPVGASGGKTEWTADELQETQSSPEPPGPHDPPVTSTGSCDAGSAEGGETSLYRATGPDEAADILDEAADILDYGFRPDPSGEGYQTGKLFANSREDAIRFGQYVEQLGGDFTHLVEARVPSEFVDSLEHLPSVDGMCASFVSADRLDELNRLAEVTVRRWP
jgi:RHS repeat-associated protein